MNRSTYCKEIYKKKEIFFKIVLSSVLFFMMILSSIHFVLAHPHPLYFLTANESHIEILAQHAQRIDEKYIKNNLILEDCNLYNVWQDEFYSRYMETKVIMEHDCENPRILKNTLFKDYWGIIPVYAHISGFDETVKEHSGDDVHKEYINETNKTTKPTILSGNFFIDIFLVFLFGVITTLMGDFIRFITPISIVDKTLNKKNFIYHSILIHLISTYIFIFFSLTFLSRILNKYLWLIFLVVGLLIFLENYLSKKNFSPYLISIIPCPGTIFIVTFFLQDRLVLSLIAPLILIGTELIMLLLIKKHIKIKKDYSKYAPYFFIFLATLIYLLYNFKLFAF